MRRSHNFLLKAKGKILKTNIAFAVIFSFAITALFFFITLHSVSKEMNATIEASEQQYTRKNAVLFDNYMYQTSLIAARFSLISDITQGDDLHENQLKRRYIQNNIANITETMPYINYIDYLDDEGNNITSPSRKLTAQVSIGEIGQTKVTHDQTPQWPNNIYLLFSSPQSVYNHNILITVKSRQLSEFCFETATNSTESIVSADGTVLLSSDLQRIGENIFPAVNNVGDAIHSGFFPTEYNGEACFISVYPSDRLDAYAVRITPKSVYHSHISNIYLNTALLTLCVFAVTCVLCFVIVLYSYRPIKSTLAIMRNYFPSDDSFSDFKSEADYINQNLLRTLKTHDNAQQTVRRNTERMRQAQISSLQAQINPHFLYNTLDAIKWLSIDMNGIANPIEKYIVMLEQILRASLNFRNNIIPFKTEISLTQSYLKLMHLRYHNRFSVQYDIAEDLGNYSTIKFILQPIIENSIKHGFANITEGGVISISAKQEGASICIRIADNGCGIAPERLAELQTVLREETFESDGHIGLLNVNSRIRLLYGDAYGISIESTPSAGTKCTLRFPISDLPTP